MGLFSSIAGAALGAAGSIFGGKASSDTLNKGYREAMAGIDKQQRENKAWYDRRYNEDATQRADAQRLLQLTEESIRKRNQQARGRQAIMGGTSESLATEKSANNAALSQTMADINAQAVADKQHVEDSFRSQDAALADQKNNLILGRAQQQATQQQAAGQQMASVGSDIIGAFLP